MGVINNLIAIRRKFRAIVGANWDGTTIAELVERSKKIEFILQPSDTDGNFANYAINNTGSGYRLQKKVSDNWTDVGSYNSGGGGAGTTVPISVTLSPITETSVCRIKVFPFGRDGRFPIYSNEFTVTRTAAQTTSAKQNMSESLETDVIKEDLTTDETPVAEKATTTKKGN